MENDEILKASDIISGKIDPNDLIFPVFSGNSQKISETNSKTKRKTRIPEEKNEIVWNYQNLSGFCNFSSLMFSQYLIFTVNHLQKLIDANHDEQKINEIFSNSLFPEVNEALYYGQTVLGLFLYSREALSIEPNINSICTDHFFTHFDSLSEIEPEIDYAEIQSEKIDVHIFKSLSALSERSQDSVSNDPEKSNLKNLSEQSLEYFKTDPEKSQKDSQRDSEKEQKINEFIRNNKGIFKSREYRHACTLLLTDEIAIYVNNSLFSRFPLVCKKNDLIRIWKSLRRWNKEEIDTEKFDSISLFDVICGFQRINYEKLSENLLKIRSRSRSNDSISGGSVYSSERTIKNNQNDFILQKYSVWKILLLIPLILILICLSIVIFKLSERNHCEQNQFILV